MFRPVLGPRVGGSLSAWCELAAGAHGAAQRCLYQASTSFWEGSPSMCSLFAGAQVRWLYVLDVPLDVLRTSAVKVVRASQTLLKLTAQICSDVARHRCAHPHTVGQTQTPALLG
jgi:hypothetical protein